MALLMLIDIYFFQLSLQELMAKTMRGQYWVFMNGMEIAKDSCPRQKQWIATTTTSELRLAND